MAFPIVLGIFCIGVAVGAQLVLIMWKRAEND